MNTTKLLAMDSVAGEAVLQSRNRIFLISASKSWKRGRPIGVRDAISWTRHAQPTWLGKEFLDEEGAIAFLREQFIAGHALPDSDIDAALNLCPPEIKYRLVQLKERHGWKYEPARVSQGQTHDVLSVMAHDLRNHLVSLSVKTTALGIRAKGADPSLIQEAIHGLQKEIESTLWLIEECLFAGRLQERIPRPKSFDLAWWLKHELLEIQKSTGRSIDVKLPAKQLKTRPFADSKSLARVLEHFIGIIPSLSRSDAHIGLTIRETHDGIELILSVKSPLGSIPEKPFERFSPIEGAPVHSQTLGLLAVHKIIESHVGHFIASGDTLTLRIPTKR